VCSVATKLAYAILATGVLLGAVAGAAWTTGVRREAIPRAARPAASGASDVRVAALEARLANIERALAVLAARGAENSDATATATERTPFDPEATATADDDQEPPVDADAALREVYASLDRRLEVEHPDAAWRPERDIEAALSSLPARPTVASASCISTFCKVELKYRTLEDGDATSEQIARLSPFAAGTLYRQDPADPLRVTLYVQRPGHLFDQEAALAPPIQP